MRVTLYRKRNYSDWVVQMAQHSTHHRVFCLVYVVVFMWRHWRLFLVRYIVFTDVVVAIHYYC